MKTQMAEYYALDPDDGLTMNLGVNPLLQFGVKETREQLCMNILHDLAVVDYVPFDSDTIGNPALDLGDVLQFTGGQADADRISAITSMTCKIGGKHSLKGVGKNPRLAQAKSKNDKNISGLLNQIEAGKIGIHTFTNASAYAVAETDVKIISIEFATSEENHAQFFGQVIVDVQADAIERTGSVKGDVMIPAVAVNGMDGSSGEDLGNTSQIGNTVEQTVSVELPVVWSEDGQALVHFTFEMNDEVILIHQPEETWHSGKHTILLYYPIENVVPNITNTFNVYMRVSGGTCSVDTGNCMASISGQSMGAAAAWDGRIEIEERTGRFALGGGLAVRAFAGEMKMETMELVIRSYSDTVGRSGIGAFCRPVEMEENGA